MSYTDDKKRIEEESKYSYQRVIGHNTEEYKYLKTLCETRWAKMSQPCKGCKYKHPEVLNNKRRCCIFPDVPRDWD